VFFGSPFDYYRIVVALTDKATLKKRKNNPKKRNENLFHQA